MTHILKKLGLERTNLNRIMATYNNGVIDSTILNAGKLRAFLLDLEQYLDASSLHS